MSRPKLKSLTGGKVCPRCLGDLPCSEFHKRASSHDGLQVYCKVCTRATVDAHRKTEHGIAYREEYRKVHRDTILARSRAWRKAHPAEHAAQQRKYYANESPEVRERRRQRSLVYRTRHPEAYRDYNNKWRLRNRERVLAYDRQRRQTLRESK